MKTKIAVVILQLTVFITAVLSQPLALNAQITPPEANMLSGVWRGQAQGQEAGLPFITLTLVNADGNLSGAILLCVVRVEQGKPVASDPCVPEPILNPSFDGQTLTFQVKYRGPLPPLAWYHGTTPPDPSYSNPLLRYRLRLISTNRAEPATWDLVTDAEAITGSPIPLGASIPMRRTAN